jgi:protocatechuate 3,4-dioxygenase beta subunit
LKSAKWLRTALLCPLLLSLSPGSLGAAVLTGAVYLAGGEERRAAAGVKVLVRAADSAEVLRSTETDAEGRYVVSIVGKATVVVSAVKRGYFLSPQNGSRRLDFSAQDNFTGVDFDLVPGGAVTGRVTDAEGEPLERVHLELRRAGVARSSDSAIQALTDDTGAYRFFGLEPGRYIMLGRRPPLNAATYYPGRAEEKEAEAIEVSAGEEASGIDLRLPGPPADAIRSAPETARGQESPGAAVQPAANPPRAGEGPRSMAGGVVVSAQTGEPLGGATLTLSYNVQGRLSTLSVKAGPDGLFLFQQLAAGVYGLSARKAGFRSRSLTGGVAVGENQARTGLEIKLDREPSIAGRVEDGEGHPVIGATVTAYALRWVRGRRIAVHGPTTSTDDRGRYRLTALPPGRYVIGAAVVPLASEQATGDLDLGTGKSFYPSGGRAVEAVPIEVRYGQELTGINLRLLPRESFSVSGLVTDSETRGPCGSCMILAFNLEESYTLSQARSSVAPDGSYHVRGLTPGTYRIVAEKQAGGRTVISSRTIEVDRRDITGVHLFSGILRAQEGRVVLESPPSGDTGGTGNEPGIAIEVILGPSDGIGTAVSARVGPDGAFRAINPPCETCMILVDNLPAGGYLQAVRAQGRELPAPEIEIPGGASPPPVELVVSFKSASLAGQLARAEGQGAERPHVEALLMLVPAANESPYLSPQTTGIRPDGSFQISGIPPGAYIAFAIPRSTKLDWGSPDVRKQMESFGRPVRLSAGRPESIELPLAAEDPL